MSIFNRELNYVAYYEKRKNRIVSVPRTNNAVRHMLLSLGFSVASIVVSGAVRQLVQKGLKGMIDTGYPWWASLLDNTVCALILVYMFTVLAPRFGFFPGINGGKLELADNPRDNKLAILIDKNPRRLNIDWFGDWAEGTAAQQEEIYSEMRGALAETGKGSKGRLVK